ncbi:unnamed protein product [Lasius platythorax]|uniref:Uncharacterized protein n=1 Tax=Lasius platythorax TaxID=488582 RepID=A0AAV2NHE3_9HYME
MSLYVVLSPPMYENSTSKATRMLRKMHASGKEHSRSSSGTPSSVHPSVYLSSIACIILVAPIISINTALNIFRRRRTREDTDLREVICDAPREKAGNEKVSSFFLVTYRRYFDTSRFAQIKCHSLPLE